MKINSNIDFTNLRKTIDPAIGYQAGFAFNGDNLLVGQELLSFFQSATNWVNFLSRANGLTGEWCVVFQRPDGEVWAATDHRSSQRLYYKVSSGVIHFAENGYELLCKNDGWDEDAVLFFLRWGYVLAERTLIEGINKLPADHALRYIPGRGPLLSIYDSSDHYSNFNRQKLSYEEAKDELKNRLLNAAKRLIRFLNGRPVILPLSGGYDSRMIAYFLHELKYPNVHCVSYGKKNNSDSCKAEKIAKKLGFPFLYINSVDPDRLDYTKDPEFLSFMHNMTGLSSCYYYQEFIAAKTIASGSAHNGTISYPSNAIILPGHQGDDLGGSQLMDYSLSREHLSAQTLSRILYSHKQENQIFDKKQKKKIESLQAGLFSSYDAEQPAYRKFEQYMQWENIPKYMLNSQQSWRFFGLDTACMLLDKELLDFAYSLPFEYRYAKRIYDDVCRDLYAEQGILFEDDLDLYGIVTSFQYRVKKKIKPFVSPFLPRPSIWKGDIIGFEQLMQPVLQRVLEDGRFHPTSINGLSFCWYLIYTEELIGKQLPL